MKSPVLWVLFFIFGLPAVLMAMGQMFVAGMVGSMFASHSSAMNSKPEYTIPGIERVLNTGSGYSTKEGFRSLVRFADVEAPREVQVRVIVSVREFLEPGESLPGSDLEEVFMEARAGIYANRECEKLLKNFAAQCLVKRSSAKFKHGEEYLIEFDLGFVQKEKFGTLPDGENVKFYEIKTEDEQNISASSFGLKQQEMARFMDYNRALRQCGKLRERFGNCAISNIMFWHAISGSGSSSRSRGKIKTKFELAYLNS